MPWNEAAWLALAIATAANSQNVRVKHRQPVEGTLRGFTIGSEESAVGWRRARGAEASGTEGALLSEGIVRGKEGEEGATPCPPTATRHHDESTSMR